MFGNVFPASGAALSDKTGDGRRSFSYSFVCRYFGLLIPFVLHIPQSGKFLIGILLGVAAFVWILMEVESGDIVVLQKDTKDISQRD